MRNIEKKRDKRSALSVVIPIFVVIVCIIVLTVFLTTGAGGKNDETTGTEPGPIQIAEGTEAYEFTHRIIAIAKAEPEIAEDENKVTKYGEYFGEPKAEWCTEFALWCIIQAGGDVSEGGYDFRSLYPDDKLTWSNGCIDWYEERNRFYERGRLVPRCGDMIFFDMEKNDNVADHTGLVTGVEYDENEGKYYILTIEGNIPGDRPSNKIRQRRIAADDKTIVGYGTFREEDIDF